MRSTLVTVSVLALLAGGTRFSSAQPKGERATIKGEVVDLWCYLEGGDRGPAKKDCATACARPARVHGRRDVLCSSSSNAVTCRTMASRIAA